MKEKQMPNNSNRVKYTRKHIEYILKNYRTDPEQCVRETGHSSSSIKMMLGNAVSRLSGNSNFLGSEFYAEVVQEYLEDNPANGKPMTIKKFKMLFL